MIRYDSEVAEVHPMLEINAYSFVDAVGRLDHEHQTTSNDAKGLKTFIVFFHPAVVQT